MAPRLREQLPCFSRARYPVRKTLPPFLKQKGGARPFASPSDALRMAAGWCALLLGCWRAPRPREGLRRPGLPLPLSQSRTLRRGNESSLFRVPDFPGFYPWFRYIRSTISSHPSLAAVFALPCSVNWVSFRDSGPRACKPKKGSDRQDERVGEREMGNYEHSLRAKISGPSCSQQTSAFSPLFPRGVHFLWCGGREFSTASTPPPRYPPL